MLIDDNAIDNMIHTKVIEKSEVSEVVFNHSSAQSAIEFLKNINKIPEIEGKRILPEIIFLDLDMPMMNGFQFMTEFEQLDEKIRKGVRIVLLTASVNSRDKEFPQKFENFHLYLNKPLSVQNILDLQ